jgi:hypothetical protein
MEAIPSHVPLLVLLQRLLPRLPVAPISTSASAASMKRCAPWGSSSSATEGVDEQQAFASILLTIQPPILQ